MTKTFAALIIAVLLPFAFATPAEAANNSRCVSNHEYHAVKNERGIRKAVAHRIFDTRGKRVHFFEWKMYRHPNAQNEIRRYRACEGQFVYVEYQRSKGKPWRVTYAYKGGAVTY